MPGPRESLLPPATLALLAVTILGTLLARIWEAFADAVRLDQDHLTGGQVWRLVTPVTEQPGPVAGVVAAILVAGGILWAGEYFLGSRRMLMLAGLTLVVANGSALLSWRPFGGGLLTPALGVLGGLASWWLRMRAPGPVSAGIGVLLVAFMFSQSRALYGVAMTLGLVLGLWLLRRVPPVYRGRIRRPGGRVVWVDPERS